MKNLILQTSPGTILSIVFLRKLAELTQAKRLEERAPHLCRLENVGFTQKIYDQIQKLCEQKKIDYAFTPDNQKLSDFKLIAMDMDSTLITIECIDEIADLLGLKTKVAAITEATMRGEIRDFTESLQRRVALLKGLEYSMLDQIYEQRLRLSPGAEAMLIQTKAAGLKSMLVSGGFTYFTERLQKRLSLDFVRANTLEVIDGKITGKVLGNIIDADGKLKFLQEVCQQMKISPAQAIVLGDGANDLKMMAIAGISVAYRAKPVVRAQTTYALNFSGLDGLLNWFE